MKITPKSKKGVMMLGIVLLTVATLVLVIAALFVFNFRMSKINKQISSGSQAEDAYSRAEILDFYLKDISSKIDSKADPAGNFRRELENYKDKNGAYAYLDLNQIESQADEKHINIGGGNKLDINFDITILEAIPFDDSSEGGLEMVNYTYRFSYSKALV
jgi:hypothetical protein